jgi:hypothetical protein
VEHRAKGTFDVVQLFTKTRADAEQRAPAAAKALRPGGVLWICWPKGSSKMTTDLTRDVLYRTMLDVGLQAVSNGIDRRDVVGIAIPHGRANEALAYLHRVMRPVASGEYDRDEGAGADPSSFPVAEVREPHPN